MCDFLLTFSLLLSLAGLSSALYALGRGHFHDSGAPSEQFGATTGARIFDQPLVETYLGYRQ